MNKKLTLAFLIISFLVVGGAFEKATAEDPLIPLPWISQSGIDLFRLCSEDVTGKIKATNTFQCIGFIEGVADAISNEIYMEELFRLGKTTQPQRELCIPQDLDRVGLNTAIRGWLKNEFKKMGIKSYDLEQVAILLGHY